MYIGSEIHGTSYHQAINIHVQRYCPTYMVYSITRCLAFIHQQSQNECPHIIHPFIRCKCIVLLFGYLVSIPSLKRCSWCWHHQCIPPYSYTASCTGLVDAHYHHQQLPQLATTWESDSVTGNVTTPYLCPYTHKCATTIIVVP